MPRRRIKSDLDCYLAIKALVTKLGRNITHREAAARCKISSTAYMHNVVVRLAATGVIAHTPHTARCIGLGRNRTIRIPLGDLEDRLFAIAAEDSVSAESVVLYALKGYLSRRRPLFTPRSVSHETAAVEAHP